MRLYRTFRRFVITAFTFSVFTLFAVPGPTSAGPSPGPQALQFSVGPWTLIDSDLRETLGTGFALDLSYSARLVGEKSPWVELSTGYYRAAGPLTDPDPTFEVDDTKMELIPISIGLRNVAGSNPDSPIRVYAGAGITWALQRWDAPFRDSESASTLGGYVELRPEFRLGDRFHLWVRQRLHLLSDNRFENSIEANASGLALTLGLRFDIAGLAGRGGSDTHSLSPVPPGASAPEGGAR